MKQTMEFNQWWIDTGFAFLNQTIKLHSPSSVNKPLAREAYSAGWRAACDECKKIIEESKK